MILDGKLAGSAWQYLPHRFAKRVSGGEWIPWDYLEKISREIAIAVFNGRGRLIIEIPPRHGKSSLVSHYTPAWFLNLWPQRSVILTTYEADFAASWGRKVRDLIEATPEIRVRVRQESSAAHRWETTAGGGMITAGAGGPIMGRGGNLLIVDDPFKNWQEAQSATIRERIINWFNSTFYTRAEPGATIIVLTTRWHEADLAGYLENTHRDSWQVIKYPALAEANDPLNRPEGEPLCPARFDKKALLDIKEALGSYLWAGLYQQRPAPAEGGIWRAEWWKYYTEPPKFNLLVQSWDTAFKKGKRSSRSCCETWGRTETGYYLLHVWKDKVEYPELKQQVIALHDKWKPAAVLVEDEASGQSLTQDLKKGTRIPAKPVKVHEADKVTRARLVSPLAEAGKVYLPERAQWLADFLDEAHSFPNSEYKDQVDAMSQALDYMRGGMGPEPRVRLL